jgi:ABC-type multidrug transport system fused ATPase/permease subunit
VRDAHQIIVLRSGEIAERGTHDELVQMSDGIYARMWNAQRKSEISSGDAVVSDE